MHFIIRGISFIRFLWRVEILQQGRVKDGVDSGDSSHDARGDEEAISGGHDSEVFRKGIKNVVLCFRGLTACPSFVIRVVGIPGPESPDDGRLTLFDEGPRGPFSKLVLMNVIMRQQTPTSHARNLECSCRRPRKQNVKPIWRCDYLLTIQSSENPSMRLTHCTCPGGLTKHPRSALKPTIQVPQYEV